MKKLLLLVASSLMLTATTTNAQSVKAYKNGTATDYAATNLEYGVINTADSIVVTGTWNAENIGKLHKSLNGQFISQSFQITGDFNEQLIKADFSNAEFTTNNLDSLFYYFHKLTQVIFPNKGNSVAISMKDIFNDCYSLKTIVNLDKFSNITNLASAFYNCSGLTSITFSASANSNSIDCSNTFYGNTKLVTVHNFDKFNNISDLNSLFYNCEKLDSIAFSSTGHKNALTARNSFMSCSSLRKIVNFEKFTNVTDISFAFYNCNKLGIIRLGNVPQKYDNAFTGTYVIFLPDGVTDYPDKYSWYSAVMLPVTSVTASGVASYVEGGAMAFPQISYKPNNTYLPKGSYTYKYEISKDGFSTFEEYVPNTVVTKDYTSYKMRIGVKNARMDDYKYSAPVDIKKYEISVYAYFDGTLKKYAKEQLTGALLNKADSITLTGTWNDDELSKFRQAYWKSSSVSGNDSTQKVDMSQVTLNGDISFWYTFESSSKLEKVILPNASSTNSISMTGTFEECAKLKEISNFEKFTNVTYAGEAFYNCSSLKEIHIGTDVNSSRKFTGSDIFTGCNALKYFPSGTTSIPSEWQTSYNNFILPFTSVSLNGTASFNIGDKFVLPTITSTPSYCAATDIVYELSNDDFATKETYTPNTKVTKDYSGYKMRVGVKNASMSNYIYSSGINVIKVNYVLTAYTNGVANKYSIEQLATGTLATADSVVLYGVWTDAQIETFRKSLKSDGNNLTTNSALKKADLSDVTLSGDITSGMEYLFRSCQNLVSVALPSSETAGKVSLYSAFNNCTTLESIASLDKLSNITCLYYAFYNCSNLESLTFASTENSNSVNMFDAFYNCSLLESIANLEKLTNVVNLRYTFSNCGKLKEIHIGSNPNSLSGTSTQYAFDNCDALVYLPESVTTVPDNWKNYKNFVLPFTAIEPSGIATIDSKSGTISLPTVTYTPSYCVGTDFVYQISNNNFSTYTTHSATDVLTGNYVGYQVRVGAKNERMNNYVYSTNSVLVGKAPLAKAYVNGVSTEYGVSDLAIGTLATADSVVLSGIWIDAQIETFRKSLKLDGNTSTTNSALKKADLSDVTLSGDITSGMEHLFSNCKTIVSVTLPSSETAGKVSLYETFNNCSSLESIANLDKLSNITCLYYAFYNCKNLKSLTFAPAENSNSVSMYSAFNGCSSLESIANLDKFTNITNLEFAFFYCQKLKSLTFASTENSNSVSMYYAFYDCSSLDSIANLDKFTNITNLEIAFYNCKNLKSLSFAPTDNGNGVSMDKAFCYCSSLDSIANLDKFTNITNLECAFYNCIDLKEIHIGIDPNNMNTSNIDDAFSYCYAIKYLPDTVTTIPDNWKSYKNFVLPITSVTTTGTAGITKEGGVMSTPSIAASPAYCAITDTIYQLSNNNFSTYTSFKKGEILKGNYVGYMLRAGVKNQRMANYVYSSASIKVEEIIPLIAYRNDTATEYSFSAIKPGILADAERIELYGAWTDTDLLNLQKALKKNWSTQNNEENSTLVNADLSKVSFSGNVSNTSRLFKNCTALIEVQLPSATIANGISLSSTFSGCTLLKYVLNLEKLDNIVKIDSAFYNCKTIGNLKFSSVANAAKIDFSSTFNGCSSLSGITNLASFQNISCLAYAFANCTNLGSLTFYSSSNNNSIDATSAFDGCTVSNIYYFEYFKNITILNNTFRNCKSLGSITLGVNPSELADTNIVGTFDGCTYANKYLPSGVDTIPTIWQNANYNNFVVPIKSIDADIMAYMTEDGEAKVSLQSITINPSYALANSYTWKYSNDNFTTTSTLSNMTIGFKAIYGVKNSSMSDYIYSDTVTATTLSTNVIVYRGKAKSTYKASALEDGLITDADSIVVEGSWDNNNLVTLANSLKPANGSHYSYNHVLKKVDFSNAAFIGSISNGLSYMFCNCDSLKTVSMPSQEFYGSVSLYETFSDCISLKNVENLDKLNNISSMYQTFYGCYKLASVEFSDKINQTSVSFYETFYDCYKLDSVDLSSFINISSLYETFYYCSSLEDVKFAETNNNNNSVSLGETFYECGLLKNIDLSSFSGISNLYRTFFQCKSLKSVSFAETINNNHAYLYCTFYECDKLESISNFDKFTNLCDFYEAFYNCSSLKEVRLGTDITTDNAKVTYWSNSSSYLFKNTFDKCNAIKYLPNTVKTIPENWKSYYNFVLPIDSVVVTGKGMIMNSGNAIMPTFTTYPSYVIATDTIWQLSADGFKTVIDYNANTQVDFSMYALRCGVKNQSMSDYVYSKNDVQFEKIECYVKAYIAGGVKTYVPNDLAVGTLAKADSVFLFGKWNDNFVQKFAKSLKTSWDAPSSESFSGNNVTNSILKKVDMSDLTHTDTIFNGSLCIFHNCKELETVILPQQQLAKWGFGLYGAFNGCTKLKNVINLDKIKTYSIEGAFLNCTSLESVTFCKEPITDGKYKLTSIFDGCTNLKQVYNFESFVDVTNLYSIFYNCINLKEIHLGFDPNESNKNGIIMSYAFYNCNAIKYLPDGVIDVPENWKNYNNFVIPFVLSASTPEYENDYLSLTCPSQTPSYAAMTDVIWKISNDKLATYATYSMTDTLSPRIAEENPLYEIYNNPLNGDFTGCMLMCVAYNPKYTTRNYYEITEDGTVKFLTDIDESEMEEFTIYPNPAMNSFQINVGSQNAEVCIFNAIGNMVVKQQVFENATIDISNLPQGIYYVKVGNQVTRLTKM